MRIFTLDNTFGYNPGRAPLGYTLRDRLAIAKRLDSLEIDYLEAGCPAAAGGVQKFFDHARSEISLRHTRLVATVRIDAVHEGLERDDEIHAAIDSGAPAVALSACCWHIESIGAGPYCRKIGETVRFLKAHALEVMLRDEDFFQCYSRDPALALRTLEAAKAAGADVLCLRDSTGAGMPQLVREACMEVRKRFEGILGICAHDDSGLALANTLEAVEQGFTHVEGSMDGYGQRRGLANLCSIISALEHRLGHTTIGAQHIEDMAEAARLVTEAGLSAFERRVRVGLAQVAHPAEPQGRAFLAERYELASHSGLGGPAVSTATATVRIGDSIRSETEDGEGAVNALERSLRQCLFAAYPEIANVHVTGYRAAVLEPARGTASRIRVTLDWNHAGETWVTDGIAGDLLEATWLAMVDGFQIALRPVTVPDASWAV